MQIFKIIVVNCILLFYSFCNISGESIPNKKIRFSVNKGNIQFFIDEMTRNYGIAFSFEPDQIPLNKEIKLQKSELFISEAFDQIFKNNGIEYIVSSNIIILRRINDKTSERKNRFTISGIIKDSKTSESLPGSVIYFMEARTADLTNEYGFFTVTVPEGRYTINITNIGYESLVIDTVIKDNMRLDATLSPSVFELQEVIVSKKENRLYDFQQGISRIEMKNIKALPSLAGEADVMRNIQTLPGVNSMSDVGGDFQVRGGAWDQNLMMLDEAMVYNSNHMYGIYSTFNTDIIKDIKFYKAAIPASYGGRVSSVMDITQKEGDMNKYHLNASLGFIMGKLSVDGPIIPDKSSFIITARRSFYEYYLKYTNNEGARDARPYFFDINGKFNFVINPNNRLYFSNYSGNDVLYQNKSKSWASNFTFGNNTSTLRFNHLFNQRLFSNSSLIYSRYKMTLNQNINDTMSYNINLGLQHTEFKNDFTYSLQNHKFNFGFSGIYYSFNPGKERPNFIDTSNSYKTRLPNEYAFESALYLNDIIKVSHAIEFQAGMRFSSFASLGKADVKQYASGQPRNDSYLTATLHYNQNEIIKWYKNIEPRLSVRFNISNNNTAIFSYNKIAQFLQLVSRTFSPLPYDMWQPCNYYIKPLIGHQLSAGWFYQWPDKSFDFSIETYYKILNNVLEVKPGVEIILNEKLDQGLVQGEGKAYGLELGITKNAGNLTGSLSYTYSRTMRKIDGKLIEEKINLGSWYSTDYDIPNKLNLACIYKVSKRLNFTANFIYQTGRPLSLPSGQFIYFNRIMPYYEGKNLSRYPDYHRMDFGAVLISRQKPGRKWNSSWTFSIYNVYARQNPYVIAIRPKSDSWDSQVYELWFFSTVPSLTYSFKF